MPFITKKYKFCAAHKYWNDNWDLKENKSNFFDDIHLHGHNYQLFITISGPIDDESGFIINLKNLNDIINKKVIQILDHSDINNDIKWFKNKQPSTENLVVFIWDQIVDNIKYPAKLHSIKLHETDTIYCEFFGYEK